MIRLKSDCISNRHTGMTLGLLLSAAGSAFFHFEWQNFLIAAITVEVMSIIRLYFKARRIAYLIAKEETTNG